MKNSKLAEIVCFVVLNFLIQIQCHATDRRALSDKLIDIADKVNSEPLNIDIDKNIPDHKSSANIERNDFGMI